MARIPFLSFFILYFCRRRSLWQSRQTYRPLCTKGIVDTTTAHDTRTHTCDRIMPVGGSARENTWNNQSLGGEAADAVSLDPEYIKMCLLYGSGFFVSELLSSSSSVLEGSNYWFLKIENRWSGYTYSTVIWRAIEAARAGCCLSSVGRKCTQCCRNSGALRRHLVDC